MEKNEQSLMDQEIVDKVKNLAQKQAFIRWIVIFILFGIVTLIVPLVNLFMIIPIVVVFILLGIGESLLFLWYIYKFLLGKMIKELAGWGYYYKTDNSNPQFEIIFNDGTYYTKDLVEAFQSYSKRIISVKKNG